MTAGRFFASGDPTQARTGPAPRPDFSALDKQRAAFYIMPYKPRNGDLRHFPGKLVYPYITPYWNALNGRKTALKPVSYSGTAAAQV